MLPALWVALAMLVATGGCASSQWVTLRKAPKNPLAAELNLLSWSGPTPSARTMQLLRRYDLEDDVKRDPRELLVKLRDTLHRDPSADTLYSLAEVAYLGGKRSETTKPDEALELQSAAVMHAYMYLFGNHYGRLRNPYDPEFRGSCELYNGALESVLRIVKQKGGLKPGSTQVIKSADHSVQITVVLRGAWKPEDFERFEFVSDYQINGLQNQYHTYGLGVPLIAVRKNQPANDATERYYPPGLSLPLTAFLRVLPDEHPGSKHHVALLEMYDPLAATDIFIAGRRVPLETDLSTPLAYCLNQPELRNLDSSTEGLLHPDKTKAKGLYMLEPYQPGKIPVLMVHGIWSSPITWMEMFNDLRSAPEIRDRYQFWFYLYPSGEPFWFSAARLRTDLAQMRQVLDPAHQQPALDQMVLVGHSMGGLVSELQTIESGDEYWKLVSKEPFVLVKGPEDVRHNLGETFFFHPNPAIRRVITIGTPHRGSKFANDTTRWVSSKLISLPQMLVSGSQQLRRDNPGMFRNENLIDIYTSVDSLSPKSPILPVMLNAPRPPWVKYHNIVGKIPDKGFIGRVAGGTDGLVAFESAHLENVASELVINADHMSVHRHPLSVLEVRRILLEHIAELNLPASRPERLPPAPLDCAPWTATAPALQVR